MENASQSCENSPMAPGIHLHSDGIIYPPAERYSQPPS